MFGRNAVGGVYDALALDSGRRLDARNQKRCPVTIDSRLGRVGGWVRGTV
ncbi:hypothetical protein SCAB_62631 [Streptomyces scabiei 87.22]|uniref:Uncharacterized protein n=1 Tax=Streptomyces scabiei (strain 87.22) TaxID=680198 RepID=C9ZAY1_STRSW|nr:hypothetical protein SCAB_62631 [Streptomyces scabiei 87.22]